MSLCSKLNSGHSYETVNDVSIVLLIPQAKALDEKNKRDLQTQREQAERHVWNFKSNFQLLKFCTSYM